LRRATLEDADLLNTICERDGLKGADSARWIADPRNVIIIEDDNAALFLWRWEGIYEAHVLFAKRGKMAIGLGALFLDLMFKAGAHLVLAVIHKSLPQASWFVRQLGFQYRGDTETIEGPSEMYQLEASQWV
jgi:hypothetical protein